jgi:N-acetylglutamate synthase
LTFTADQQALAAQLENSLLTVWPSESNVMMDGWVLRVAGGYSGRANSASALSIGATLSTQQLDQIEAHYAAVNLPPTVRLTPVAAEGVSAVLHARSYMQLNKALTQTASLNHKYSFADHLNLATQPHDVWLHGVCRSQSGHKRFPEKLYSIVSRITVPHRFATLRVDGQPVAFGLCVLDRSWAEIGCVMVDTKMRGQSCGRAIVTSLMSWATSVGAKTAFLQVDASNTPARRLYESLGFATQYPYETWSLEPGRDRYRF